MTDAAGASSPIGPGISVGSTGAADITLPAELIASQFGLSPDRFMLALRLGQIRQVTEHGSDDDAGRVRITFRYRRRRCQVVVDHGQAAVITR
ncbi:MAG TPA: DUF6522 family protein [Acetobacteraceae bacterium]|nr:DUF6522 family protein [Acetobacteraceae bacterium]